MRFFDIQNILTIKVEVGVTTRGRRLWISLLWISVKTKSNKKKACFYFSADSKQNKVWELDMIISLFSVFTSHVIRTKIVTIQ